jgi:hypothetical protein
METIMEFGRYVVLSTAHVHYATAELLTAWALLPPADQPLAVASTQYGWFVSTRPLSDPADRRVPEELLGLLSFGREQRCDYVLLDCDGDRTDALPVFPW